jgi:hypothetical protein
VSPKSLDRCRTYAIREEREELDWEELYKRTVGP